MQMKKKIVALMLVLCMIGTLSGCGNIQADDYVTNEGYESETVKTDGDKEEASKGVSVENIKVGVLYISDPSEGSGYSYTHDLGVQGMQSNLVLSDEQIVRKIVDDLDVPGTEKAINEFIEEGCNVIFTTSWGYMETTAKMAEQYPDIYFSHGTGYMSNGAVLSCCVTDVLVPGIYIFLTVAVVNAAVGDALMKKMKDFVKWLLGWGLKMVLYAFTGYVSITGVVSGTADQTALKAAKVTFGSMIPVVGSIISDASETILVGAAVVKNSVGIYGMLVLVAIVIGPFLKIGLHYLLLKLTAAVCGIFCEKTVTGLMEDFSAAMGLVLAMTGTVCLLLLISMTCFLKGMG